MSSYIILAAGVSRNMMTRGPSSLLDYDGRTVIDHQIKTIKSLDRDADICYVLGFNYEKIVSHILSNNYDIRVVINQSYKTNSQVDSLRFGINATKSNDCYIIHGDVIFNKTAIPQKNKSYTSFCNGDKRKVGICYQDNKLINLSYGISPCWSQIVHLTKPDFDLAKNKINSFKKNMLTFEFINSLSKEISISILEDAKAVEIARNYESFGD